MSGRRLVLLIYTQRWIPGRPFELVGSLGGLTLAEYEAARRLAETPIGTASSTPADTDATSAPSTTSSELEEFERKYGSDEL